MRAIRRRASRLRASGPERLGVPALPVLAVFRASRWARAGCVRRRAVRVGRVVFAGLAAG